MYDGYLQFVYVGKIIDHQTVLQAKLSVCHQQIFSPPLPDFSVSTSCDLVNLHSSHRHSCPGTDTCIVWHVLFGLHSIYTGPMCSTVSSNLVPRALGQREIILEQNWEVIASELSLLKFALGTGCGKVSSRMRTVILCKADIWMWAYTNESHIMVSVLFVMWFGLPFTFGAELCQTGLILDETLT